MSFNDWNCRENFDLFFSSGAPRLGKTFRVKVFDGAVELVNVRIEGADSGEAVNKVLDSLAHPDEKRLEIRVTD